MSVIQTELGYSSYCLQVARYKRSITDFFDFTNAPWRIRHLHQFESFGWYMSYQVFRVNLGLDKVTTKREANWCLSNFLTDCQQTLDCRLFENVMLHCLMICKSICNFQMPQGGRSPWILMPHPRSTKLKDDHDVRKRSEMARIWFAVLDATPTMHMIDI